MVGIRVLPGGLRDRALATVGVIPRVPFVIAAVDPHHSQAMHGGWGTGPPGNCGWDEQRQRAPVPQDDVLQNGSALVQDIALWNVSLAGRVVPEPTRTTCESAEDQRHRVRPTTPARPRAASRSGRFPR